MSQLKDIRQRLSALRGQRRMARWGTVYATVTLAVVWVLAALFAIDVSLELSVVQRVAMLVLAAIAVVWACRRFAAPFFGVRESETDLALRVERQHGIDSDLVAAIQFERPEAIRWGSRDLESAVIAKVAQIAPRLDVAEGNRIPQLAQRGKILAISLIAVLIMTAIFPRHVAVFFSRLLLSGRHYPSSTTIEAVYMNNHQVLQWSALSARPEEATAAQGQRLEFHVRATGVLPPEGTIECVSRITGAARTLPLRRMSSDELARLDHSAPQRPDDVARMDLYSAEMSRLVEDFQYTIRLGDAWTDPAVVRMIALPVVEVSIHIEPPAYARLSTEQLASTWQVSVLEGSRVRLAIKSINKPLRGAKIRFHVGGESSEQTLTRVDDAGLQWQLAEKGSPLSPVAREVRYELQVTDVDGLNLEAPLRGYVQLKPDRPPSASAMIVHRVVLPTARPVIEYRLNDDYGIASAVLNAQIERQAVTAEPDSASVLPANRIEIPLDPRPLVGENLPKRGQFPLDLSSLRLEKGDQLKVTLEVTDYRGELAGKTYLSEPLLLQISDEAGVLAAITAADELSEKRLNDVIKQQLGVGGKK